MITTTLTPSRSAPTIEQTAHIAAAAYRMKRAPRAWWSWKTCRADGGLG
jgi:hypothetical protein